MKEKREVLRGCRWAAGGKGKWCEVAAKRKGGNLCVFVLHVSDGNKKRIFHFFLDIFASFLVV